MLRGLTEPSGSARIGASDFPCESARSGLTSLKRKRRVLDNSYHSMPFACASGPGCVRVVPGTIRRRRDVARTHQFARWDGAKVFCDG